MAMVRTALVCMLAGLAAAGPVLLNTGGPFLQGIGWRADTGKYASKGAVGFTGGGPNSATGTWAAVYESHCWTPTGDLEFRIPVPAGSYVIDLLFAETWGDSGLGVREFTVKLNGEILTQAGPGGVLDVFKRAGGLNKPVYIHLGKKPSVDGFITVTLGRIPGKENPMISGIAIFGENADRLVGEEGLGDPIMMEPPTAPGGGRKCPEATTTTGRLGPDGFVMNAGGIALPNIGWGADNTNYIVEADKGKTAAAPVQVRVPGTWGPVYLTHRWTRAASLTYKIPVPAGMYKVSVLHTESFMSRVGQRTFGITINGVVKAVNYDVFAAVGKDKPLFRSFPGIRSVGGFIKISFTKGTENPFVNGIYISGPGAGSVALGGPEDGSCTPTDGTPPDTVPPPPPSNVPAGVKFSEHFVTIANGSNAKLAMPAVVIYGPDYRLYLGTTSSTVHALALNKDFQVTKQCDVNVEDTVPRAVLGLAFNPRRRGLKLHFSTGTLFWQDQKLFNDFGAGWTNGKVETITMASPTGCFKNDRADFITGLPVSNRVHSVNALEFLPSGELLIAVGGFTNAGVSTPGDKLGGLPGNPLSGAIVTCYASRFSRTAIRYSSLNDPGTAKLVGGGCMPYATGLRNVYGMTYHTNRGLYAADNGPAAGAGNFSTDCVGGMRPSETLEDKLHRVVRGKCHGHPNINRGECVFNDPKCVKPLLDNVMSSTNGVLEYRSNTFDGLLKGNLFLSQYALKTPGGVGRVVLNAGGGVVPAGFTKAFHGKSGLAIVEGPRGEMVMPRLIAGEILVLRPEYAAPAKTTLISVMPRRGPAGGRIRVLVTGHNFGKTPTVSFGGKACTAVVSIDADSFTCVTPAGRRDKQVAVVVTGSAGASASTGSDFWYF